LFNIRWGVIAGGIAFVLSFLVGTLSGAHFFSVLLRAGIFTVLFFALGTGAYVMINSYLPELLVSGSMGEDEVMAPRPGEQPGSRINITLGGTGALPEMYQNSGGAEEVGNINDLMSGAFVPEAARNAAGGQGMDQSPQDGYNNGGNTSSADYEPENGDFGGASGGRTGFEPAPVFNGPVFTASVGEGDDLGGLPDLDAMAGAFLSGADEEPAETLAESPAPARSRKSGKTQSLDGDFNPKDLAAGIRTVLNKEKQG
jgi:hypothetical protein